MDEEREKDQSENDCSNLSGTELFEDLVRGCVFTQVYNQQVKNKSADGSGLEQKILFNEKDQRRVGELENEGQRELTLEDRLTGSELGVDEGCKLAGLGDDNRGDLGSEQNAMDCGGGLVLDNELGQLQQAGINCCVEDYKKFLFDVDKQKDVVDVDRQCCCGVCDQKMASEKRDARNRQKDQSVVGKSGNRALDEAYTWIRQSDDRLIKQIGEK
ncbi:MAG: hypothetical protein EZS28_047261 [Streblomastix strix]|uniref:Uncharacterized protein n=1 Tax=Streblomastix strix TaxID=222440 RepID=A0A5J4THD4_9EUKA|nr:MAG: hypothetical protein EZS28_047261 [Streblomastix strix]